MVEFTATQRAAHWQHEAVRILEDALRVLRQERDASRADCQALQSRLDAKYQSLHDEQILNATLKVTRRGDRWKDAATAVASLLGAGLISSGTRGGAAFCFGWAFMGLAAIYQLLRSLWNTP